MLRINKMTDYSLVLLRRIGSWPGSETHNARDLAEKVNLPLPMVSKILKVLTRGGILDSQRGAKGGYRLARPSVEISVADVIRAIEGPIAFTECTTHSAGLTATECSKAGDCPIHESWERINRIVEKALEEFSLAELLLPAPDLSGPYAARNEEAVDSRPVRGGA